MQHVELLQAPRLGGHVLARVGPYLHMLVLPDMSFRLPVWWLTKAELGVLWPYQQLHNATFGRCWTSSACCWDQQAQGVWVATTARLLLVHLQGKNVDCCF